MHFKTTTGFVGFQWVIFSAWTLLLWLLPFLLLYCSILKSIVILSKGHFNLVFNFAPCFCSQFQLVSTFKKNTLVACIKPRTADFMFVFLLTLPTKLWERLVCLFLWYFNCSLCKLNYAKNSMWTFYQNKYLVSVPASLVASFSFLQRGTRSGRPLCFAALKFLELTVIPVKSFRNGCL